jgi:hypothetical protein
MVELHDVLDEIEAAQVIQVAPGPRRWISCRRSIVMPGNQ